MNKNPVNSSVYRHFNGNVLATFNITILKNRIPIKFNYEKNILFFQLLL